MRRRLILMRHAKSSWKSNAPTDHARPLNKRGRRAAPKVGARLRELGWVPDLIVSSDSARTRETFVRMREALGHVGDAVFLESLYHAGIGPVHAALEQLDDAVSTVLLLGHNPGWEQTLHWLSGRDETMQTGASALLMRDTETWSDAAGAGWTLEALLRPREL